MGAPYGSEFHHRRYSIKNREPANMQQVSSSDIIAGKDFLSLVISASAADNRRLNLSSSSSSSRARTRTRSRTRATTTTTPSSSSPTSTSTATSTSTSTNKTIDQTLTSLFTTEPITSNNLSTVENDLITDESEEHRTVIRDSRSSVYSYQYDYDNNDKDQTYYATSFNEHNNVTDSENEGKILSVSSSTSIGSQINKDLQNDTDELETATNYQITDSEDNNAPIVPLALKSYENPNSRAAQSTKTVLNIDEMEPITIDTTNNNNNPLKLLQDSLKDETTRQQAAAILGANPDYLKQLQQQQQQAHQPLAPHQHPYHQTIVFHGQSTKDGSGRGRSVSYSSIIQNVGPPPAPNWEQASESIERPQFVQNTHTILNKDYGERAPSEESHLSARLESSTTTSELPSVQQQQQQQSSRWRQQPHYLEYEHNYNYHNSPTTPKYLPTVYATPEQNYEVDESVSVMTNGRTHGVQQPVHDAQQSQQSIDETNGGASGQADQSKTDDAGNNNNNHKVGYVVEGRNFRKYRVEERTSDGFIVGEYGVVSHDDGSLRGVRYTADGTINPRLIYDALMKFLSL